MNLSKFRRKAFAVALHLSLATAAISTSAQQSRPLSRDDLIAAAREIMTTTRYCALITFDRAGRAQARTMDAFAPDENMSVWMATNPKSRKVAEIRRRPRVTLYYFDRQSEAYVTVHGTARLVNDANEKARHWKNEWQAFYPNRDKDYLLIEVRPERLEVVNVTKGIIGDSRTWNPPSVTFRWERGRPRPQ
jgi:general stress protein 26